MNTSLTSLFLLTLGLSACGGGGGGGGGGGPFVAANQLGTWSGTWNNTTFSSTGPVTMTVTQAGDTYTIAFDMGGNVFGGADPALESFTATVSATGATLTPTTSAVYGDLTGSLGGGGTLTISGQNITGAVDRFAFTGTWSATQVTGNVTITFDDTSTAAGTATLTKV
ncbi:MAG: hypothetical protein AB7O97_00415 [Planctomycetota bacterium]